MKVTQLSQLWSHKSLHYNYPDDCSKFNLFKYTVHTCKIKLHK